MALSSPLTVVGMINGMIGGLILILPVYALNAGYAFTILVILITGAFSFYSCYLCVIHLGDQKDLDYAMFVHFNKSLIIKIVYDLTVFSNLLLISFLYFQLICIQWIGIVGEDSVIIPLVNAAVLFSLILLLKYIDFGASVMAYGIVSIIGYIIFLIWVVVSAPSSGQNHWEPIGTGQISLAAAMGGAFSIQTFFIPVLKQNPNQKRYVFYTLLAYIIGSSAYLYIAFMGTFGILNRSVQPGTKGQDIEAYFPSGRFQLKIIESIYLVHLYSVFPEFTLISLKRLFSIFKLKQTKPGKIPIPEIIYAIIYVGICLTIRLVKVGIDEIVNLNGSVIGFFFIYFLPAILHIRCLYFAKNKITFKQKQALDAQDPSKAPKVQLQDISRRQTQNVDQKNDSSRLSNRLSNRLLKSQNGQMPQQLPNNIRKKQSQEQTVRPFGQSDIHKSENQGSQNDNSSDLVEKDEEDRDYFICDCDRPKSLILKIFEIILIFCMIGIGAFIMVNGLMTV